MIPDPLPYFLSGQYDPYLLSRFVISPTEKTSLRIASFPLKRSGGRYA
jgi:hypothetical protein